MKQLSSFYGVMDAENHLKNRAMEAVNHSKNRAMEADTISKHGRSSKSHTSRRNFLKMASITLLIVGFGISVYAQNSNVTVTNWNVPEITLQTAGDLRAFRDRVNARNDFSGQTFTLSNDINIESDNQWVPIGTIIGGDYNRTEIPFNGTFDGNGKVIKGVKISGNNSRQGLFGYLGAMGTIKNLGVVDVNIKGDTRVGGLVGSNSGIIENCYVSGNVIINGTEIVGGLVGVSVEGGRIENCHASGNIGGKKQIGGLVGVNNSTIENCYTSGSVRGTETDAGGLVGQNNESIIKKCYATGNVTGKENVGGLVGSFSRGGMFMYSAGKAGTGKGAILNSYATGNVTGDKNIGGLTGYIALNRIENCFATGNVKGNNNVGGLTGHSLGGTGKITNCYSVGNVVGNDNLGGLVGNTDNQYNDAITNCYYDTQKSEQFDARKGKPMATEDMKKQSTYSGWDFIRIWIINPDINDGLPYLRGVGIGK